MLNTVYIVMFSSIGVLKINTLKYQQQQKLGEKPEEIWNNSEYRVTSESCTPVNSTHILRKVRH